MTVVPSVGSGLEWGFGIKRSADFSSSQAHHAPAGKPGIGDANGMSSKGWLTPEDIVQRVAVVPLGHGPEDRALELVLGFRSVA
jgi:hypothetical protein